jgi:hypothetical protein
MINTLDEALVLYLGQTHADSCPDPVPREDLIDAAKAAAEWRKVGPRATALVLTALRDDGMTFRQIEQETGHDHITVQRMIRRLEEGEL